MKPEPLKDKVQAHDDACYTHCCFCSGDSFSFDYIKSAVEWWQEKILEYANNKLGGEIREIPELTKAYNLMKEAFEDITKTKTKI